MEFDAKTQWRRDAQRCAEKKQLQFFAFLCAFATLRQMWSRYIKFLSRRGDAEERKGFQLFSAFLRALRCFA